MPLALKIAPDLTDDAVDGIARLLVKHAVDGVIATNTTLARDAVAGLPHAGETGGLSGAPLRERSTAVVRRLARALDGALPIIGVGGITPASAHAQKLDAGATLVQLYTGLIYRGPALVAECVRATVTAASARRDDDHCDLARSRRATTTPSWFVQSPASSDDAAGVLRLVGTRRRSSTSSSACRRRAPARAKRALCSRKAIAVPWKYIPSGAPMMRR